MRKYIVIGGYVISRHDCDKHYVNANRLMELYRVAPGDCITYENISEVPMIRNLDDFIVLRPREDGDYSLPTWSRKVSDK